MKLNKFVDFALKQLGSHFKNNEKYLEKIYFKKTWGSLIISENWEDLFLLTCLDRHTFFS